MYQTVFAILIAASLTLTAYFGVGAWRDSSGNNGPPFAPASFHR